MPLYEHVVIARQDISSAQAESLIAEFSEILTANGGTIVATEYWGLRSMAYKINKNRKGHYGYIRSDVPAAGVAEFERRARINEDVMRTLSIKVEAHEEGQSAVLNAKNNRDDRRDDRGPRGPRPDRGDRPDRGPRPDRGDRPERFDRPRRDDMQAEG